MDFPFVAAVPGTVVSSSMTQYCPNCDSFVLPVLVRDGVDSVVASHGQDD